MRFLLVKALAELHCYSQFANSLQRALVEIGHEAVVSDQSGQIAGRVADVRLFALELQRGRYDAVVSFSSFFGNVALEDGGPSLYDALDVTFVGWQLDHPIYAPASLTRKLQRRLGVYANRSHQAFADAIRLPGRAAVMLPGGEPLPVPLTDYKARRLPIFIAATCNGRPQAPWTSLPDTPAKRLLVGVIDRLLADPEVSLLAAFNGASTDLGLGAQLGKNPAFDDQMIAFLRDPLTYVRQKDRVDIITDVADAGLPLALCGPGWKELIGDRSNVIFIEQTVDFADLPRLYNEARIVLNWNSGNGACERALYAAFAGAAVVSDDSAQLAAALDGGTEVTFFNRARRGAVAEALGDLIESDRGEAVAERGFARVSRDSRWAGRAEQLVRLLTRA